MPNIVMMKIDIKFHIDFTHTSYFIRMKNTKAQIQVTERELEPVLERIHDMSEDEFAAFSKVFLQGSYDVRQ